jgi:hypothetical protein
MLKWRTLKYLKITNNKIEKQIPVQPVSAQIVAELLRQYLVANTKNPDVFNLILTVITDVINKQQNGSIVGLAAICSGK